MPLLICALFFAALFTFEIARFPSGPSNTRFWGLIDRTERKTAMNELDFLNNEARIASAIAPEGAQLAVVASLRPDRYDASSLAKTP